MKNRLSPLFFNYAALGVCAVACCAWSYVLDLKYYHLAYYSWDLALYANLMWNLCHGSTSTSLYGGSFLVDHCSLIAFLLVPFYYFFQSALTLLYFKLFAFFIGAYIFYLLAAKRLGGPWAFAFMLAYILYPANVTMIFFEFNFENLALPIIFLLFYYFEEKKFLSFMVCCFFLVIVKENMPLVVLMFGIYGLLTRREGRLRWGLVPLLLGAGMFLGEVFVLIPWFRHGLGSSNVHWNLYSNLGASPHEVVRTFIFKEPEVLKLLFNQHNGSFLLKLFGPLLIPALLAPQVLLIATPLFLQDLLSTFSGQQSIYYFYSSVLTVFIFMAAAEFLGWVKSNLRRYLLFPLFIFLCFFDLMFIPKWRGYIVPYQEKQAVAQYFLSQIPPDAQVISSYKFLYLLSQRKDLYILLRQSNVFSSQREIVPKTVDYMMIDFDSRVDSRDLVKKLLSQGRWTVQAAADEVILLRKNAPQPGELLIKTEKHPFLSVQAMPPVMMEGNVLRMEGVDLPVSLKFGQRILRLVFYWKALENDKNENLPPISLSIFKGFRRFYFKNRTLFYGLPVKKGEYDKEIVYYLLPQLSPGDYRVAITFPPSNLCIKNISVKI